LTRDSTGDRYRPVAVARRGVHGHREKLDERRHDCNKRDRRAFLHCMNRRGGIKLVCSHSIRIVVRTVEKPGAHLSAAPITGLWYGLSRHRQLPGRRGLSTDSLSSALASPRHARFVSQSRELFTPRRGQRSSRSDACSFTVALDSTRRHGFATDGR